MACFHPMKAWKNGDGKGFHFQRQSMDGTPTLLPCGQCIACKLERSKMWATRIVHEAQMHTENTFLTLTYNEKNLPTDGSLVKQHAVDFMKKYRSYVSYHEGKKIRFFLVGEYGEQFSRPHYHAIIFGHSFMDSELFMVNRQTGEAYFTSDRLSRLWNMGHTVIGDVTPQSAAYCARYCVKKVTGRKQREGHYVRTDEYGVVTTEVDPEFALMSRNPGIGKSWWEKYGHTDAADDHLVLDGNKVKIPRYYDNLEDPEIMFQIKQDRKERAREFQEFATQDKKVGHKEVLIKRGTLSQSERTAQSRANKLIRSYENGQDVFSI